MALDTIDITLSSVNYHEIGKFSKSGNKYLIARTTTGLTIKGEMEKPIPGERYRLWGETKKQKPWKNRPAEDAFEFTDSEPIIDQSEAGVANYLRNYVDKLGIVKAQAIVEHFGPETLTVLRTTPERALEVHGITEAIVDSIREHFEKHVTLDPAAYAKLIDMFSGHKVPVKIIKTLLKDFGSDAPRKIKENPYILLAFPRMGWKTIDSIATSVCGYPADGVERHKWAIVEGLERISSQGHTYASQLDIEKEVFGFLGSRPIPDAWGAAEADDLITPVEDDSYALPKIAEAERTIARCLATLMQHGNPLPFSLPNEGLNTGQRDALRTIEANPVVVLCGAPGVGKTYTITRALTGLVSQGFQAIRFATPTGKAAKRAEELLTKALPNSGIVPSTIHRLLQPTPSLEPSGVPRESAKMGRGREEFGFGRNEDNPIDAQLLVVDEASMLDVILGASLLKSIAPGTRVIFVGDPNQLPSVGPGSVLRDMIAAGVPTATLTEIQRNSGRIVKACHAILGGDVPEPAPKVDIPNGENWIHVELSEPAEINKRIVALHESARKNGKFDPEWDMQVISPEKKKAGVGCDDLNRALSDLLNPFKKYDPEKVVEDDAGRPPVFEVGDKVLRDKNGLADRMLTQAEINELGLDSEGVFSWEGTRYGLVETDVVNGDMGTVRAIVKNADNWYVIVQFNNPYRLCRLPYGDSHLIPAYAVTCHKAQGSGFPYVIVPCHSSFYMWNREMIYTLFSRSERLLVTVGQKASIRTGIGRKTIDHRNTRLESLLLPLFAPQGVELSHA